MIDNKTTHKLSNEDVKEIALSYYLNRSTANVEMLSKKYDVSKQYIYKLVKQDKTKELVKNSITSNESLFSKKMNNIINKTLDKLEGKLDDDNFKRVNYKDVAIMLGTLYDKARLEDNLSTENKAIEINIKIEK